MDTRSKYQTFLIQYHAGVARDLPTISPFALELARQPRTRIPTLEHLTRAYQTDPFLAAKLTGASSSIYFAHDPLSVPTVPQALRRVGIRYAINLIWEAPPLPVSIDPAEVARLWSHCMAVAHICRAISLAAPDAPFEPDVAHLVALIHDIGYLLQLNYSPSTWSDILHRLEREERETDNEPHARQGEELAKFWSVPRPALAAIRAHHNPESCAESRERWLATAVALGEALLQRSLDAKEVMAGTWRGEPWRQQLEVSREALATARVNALRVFRECMALSRDPNAVRSESRMRLVP